MSDVDTVVEVDEHYQHEIQLKRQLLSGDHSYYYQSILSDSAAEWDVVEKVIDDLVRHDPVNFSIFKNSDSWTFENKRLNEKQTFIFGNNATLAYSPMDWIGRQIQEDLVILNTEGVVVAGQLCFPSGWALEEKIGKQFIEVHAPLPKLTNPMIHAASKLIERIPVGKPVSRNNWGFRLGDQLDLSSKHSTAYRKELQEESTTLTLKSIGEKIFLRVEHQTLSRLMRSGYVLFTIHTYNSPLYVEAANEERRARMFSFLQSTPADMIEYKMMSQFIDLLKDYLSSPR